MQLLTLTILDQCLLTSSLHPRATMLYTPVLQATTIMDFETLHSDICSVLHSDPSISKQLSNLTLRWTIDPTGLLRHDNRIYVPDSENLRLRVLQYRHDHPISGHFGHNCTSPSPRVPLEFYFHRLYRETTPILRLQYHPHHSRPAH